MDKTTNIIDRWLLEGILEDLDLFGSHGSLRDTYQTTSGELCVAIMFRNFQELGRFMFKLGEVSGDTSECFDVLNMMAGVCRTDSVGTAVRLYFPGFTFGSV